MNDEIKEILEIFKQVDLEPESGGCYNCPKKDKDKTCIGCLNNAKDKLLDYIHNLYRNNWGNEVKATNQKIKIKELEKRIVKLKDNITNLQQENQELNDSKQWWNNRFNAVQRDYEELQQENKRLKLNIHQLKQKLEAKNKRIKTIKDILNGRSDE